MQTTRVDNKMIRFKFYRVAGKNKLRFVRAKNFPITSIHPAFTPDADRYADNLSIEYQERIYHQFQIEY